MKNLKPIKTNSQKQLLKLYNNPEKLLSTILVANNTINIAIVLLVSIYLSSRIFDFSTEPVMGFIIDAVVITFLLLFFGEIMPKVLCFKKSSQVALFMALPTHSP